MTNAGDLGHTSDGHNRWEERVTAQAARFGVEPPAFTGPHQLGDPEHIAIHNTYAAAIRPILAAAGIEAELPDEANVGDTGHIADHDLLFAAVAALEALTTPDAPTLVTATAVPAGVELTWSPPAVDGGYPILGYRIEYRATGATEWIRVQPDTAADASTGVAMTGAVGTFEVRVKAVNRLGAGRPSNVLEAEVTTAYNNATGGTITEVDNYNGTGQRWRVHAFTTVGTDTFTITVNGQPFRILVVGGGGGGANGNNPPGNPQGARGGATGGAGYHSELAAEVLDQPTYAVVVGAAGTAPANTDSAGGGNGGASSFGTVTANGGLGGRQFSTVAGGDQFTSDITGTMQTYCIRAAYGSKAAPAPPSYGSSDGGAAWLGSGPGRQGAVFVAYQIG